MIFTVASKISQKTHKYAAGNIKPAAERSKASSIIFVCIFLLVLCCGIVALLYLFEFLEDVVI